MVSLEVNGKKYEGRGEPGCSFALGDQGACWTDGHEVWLRKVALRCLHGPYRWQSRAGPVRPR